MAFVSLAYNSYDSEAKQYIYTLVDSEFGSVKVGVEDRWSGIPIAL